MDSRKSQSLPARAVNGGIKKAASPRQSTPISRKAPPASSTMSKNSPSGTPKPAPPPSVVKSEGDVRRDAWRSETMFKIIDLIKSDERPFRFSEVQLHVGGVAWQKDTVLLKSLKDSANVEIDDKAESIQYKWKYAIKNKNDLLEVLRTYKGVTQLDDIASNTFSKQLHALTFELARDGWIRILERQKGSDAPKSVYYDPWSQTEECRMVNMSDADRELWESVLVDPEQVEAELKKLELTSITAAEKPKPKQGSEQTKKKARKATSRAVKLIFLADKVFCCIDFY
ncbi:hypothetical protein SeMB42_g01867 [Synchytrium endobioticum]|uniref:Transcription initiation factor IIE subunit beta n=1 Tax=Synchytrium endobioticum TaxID=286115 RepID=A0A507D5Y2_9FUNG|nr:hypothetical protein SeLEV6574_g03086 [Synchytrium endobioticum]TPX51570.1 hypothetical protein SeMB42_g01867 [Synchytrium endobioticum]